MSVGGAKDLKAGAKDSFGGATNPTKQSFFENWIIDIPLYENTYKKAD